MVEINTYGQHEVAYVACTNIATVLGITCRVHTDIMTILEATLIQNQGTRETFPQRGEILHNPCLLPPLIYRNSSMSISQASV